MIEKIKNRLEYLYINNLIFLKKRLGINFTTFKLKSGHLFQIRNIDIVGLALLRGEHFEFITRSAIMSIICEGMTVLDLGANIGYYTIQMAHKVGNTGRVVAFEPNPVVVEQLHHNIQLNNLSNIIVETLALSNTNGTCSFCAPEPGKESHGSLKQNISFTSTKQLTVKTKKLDDVLHRLGISKVDFIKIDVEGAEKLIFQGATELLSKRHKPTIIFECAESLCQPFGHRVIDVLIFLKSFGYDIEQFDYGMWLAQPNTSK
jgi:FkbM family methyltransferase